MNLQRNLKVANKVIGDNQPVFITYEAGPTHNGIESAIALVREAAKANADAIKFQIFDPDKLVSDKNQLFKYSILKDKNTGQTEDISEPLYDLLLRRCLTQDEWKVVKKEADNLDLAFFATIGFEEDLKLLQDIKCDSVKIASADVDHYPLLRLAARSGLNVQLDTGSSELPEIINAVKILEDEGCNSIIIHQCPSGYPARIPSICLRMIPTLRETFPNYPIAYSDHTPDADMDIAAVALGVNMIEKTITLDRTTKSVEHIFSLEPPEMTSFIKRIRDIENALGSDNRLISLDQKLNRKMVRRSPYVTQSYSKGTCVAEINVEFRRPGIGISPAEFESIRSLKTANNLEKDSVIRIEDIQF
ncbi:N-acetylneuraminic acid synthase [Synechococcus sp. MIT S9220]|uniref:N-acetylneuraminate synthase family protein n=1 Tax=unclassified Synechococcus TaxID=2626047 RepID=UPI00164C689B|nr:N-acetylneuraminate synthase family protein [Synechococcus sp. MIT S9220]NOL48032.1 N-acetylneuraminate synthase [Synechococcus sp. MIT S9220]QNJ21532.1 N-acetylneuraminic acid synthase [Synechococcus sp. MIT S9220]